MYTADLKTEYDTESQTLTLIVSGEIDHHTAFRLREKADREIAVRRPKSLVLDLSDVAFMDSAGLGFILGRFARAQTLGAGTFIRGASDQIMRIIKLSGTDKYVKIMK